MNGSDKKPLGVICSKTNIGQVNNNSDIWYSHDIDCPKDKDGNDFKVNIIERKFPNVAIIGAGISGLTIAYELVRAFREQNGGDNTLKLKKEINITIYEKNSYAGGKIIGYFKNDKRPVEHSTRIYTIGYVALFDVLKNIPSINKDGPRFKFNNDIKERCVLDDLIPMFTNYKNATTFESNYTNMPGESPVDSVKGLIRMLKKNKVSNSDIIQIITKFSDFYSADYATRLSLTAGMTIGQYLEYSKLSIITQKILNSYIGIIVAARVQCDAFSIMGLFEALGVFGSPKTTNELVKSGLSGGNMFPGPSSEYFIDPLVKYLVEAGVKFNFNSKLTYEEINKLNVGENAKYDAVCLAVPHMVASDILGPEIFPTSVLRNEWSFGVQYYIGDLSHIDKIMNHRKEQNIYNTVLGSSWQIVYTIEYSKKGADVLKTNYGYDPFWGKNDMGTVYVKDKGVVPVLATITATISNQNNPGIIVGKPVLMCNPTEVLTEILAEMGADSNSITNILSGSASFGSILYVTEDETKTKYSSSEWMKGPLQSNGYRWISDYTLFISSPTNPTFGTNGMCSITNMYNNPSCIDANELPAEIADIKKNAEFHYFGVSSKVINADGKTKYIVPATFKPVPDRWYLAGEYCSTPNLQIPTMERACESGKIVAQKIISDFGIISSKRLENYSNGIKPEVSLSNTSSISLIVQVNGLEKSTDLINFTNLTKFQKLQVALYTGFQINYPRYIRPVVIVVVLSIIILCALLIYRKIKKKSSKRNLPG
jgi:hypothetical protein